MTKLEKRKLLLIVLAIVIPVILLTVVFLPPILNLGNNSATQYYDFNQEVMAFPTANTSITFTSWTFTSAFDVFKADENTNLIILNFTIKNTADTEISTRSNLQYSPEDGPYSPREAPLLKYDDDYAEAKTEIPYAHYWRLWKPQTTLLPDESAPGLLVYEIPKEHTPTELVYPSKDSPQIIINIK